MIFKKKIQIKLMEILSIQNSTPVVRTFLPW